MSDLIKSLTGFSYGSTPAPTPVSDNKHTASVGNDKPEAVTPATMTPVESATTSVFQQNLERAAVIAVSGIACALISTVVGDKLTEQEHKEVAKTVTTVIAGLTVAGVVTQGKPIVDMFNPINDAVLDGVKSVASFGVEAAGYVSNVTGTTWLVSTVWNKSREGVKAGWEALPFGAKKA